MQSIMGSDGNFVQEHLALFDRSVYTYLIEKNIHLTLSHVDSQYFSNYYYQQYVDNP